MAAITFLEWLKREGLPNDDISREIFKVSRSKERRRVKAIKQAIDFLNEGDIESAHSVLYKIVSSGKYSFHDD